jgi:hypothetical protein
MNNTEELTSLLNTTGVYPISYKEQQLSYIPVIILDITTLPSEYQSNDIKESIEKYEKDFNVRVIPLDFSIQNTKGNNTAPIILR